MELQRLRERLLHGPHRIEESLALGTGGAFQRPRFALAECSAGRCQHIARPVYLQIDANPQFRVRSGQRGVAAAMTEALAGGLCSVEPGMRAQRPADRKLLTLHGPAQARHANPFRLRELSWIKVLGSFGRCEPQMQFAVHGAAIIIPPRWQPTPNSRPRRRRSNGAGTPTLGGCW
jgi:hypothetical protein